MLIIIEKIKQIKNKSAKSAKSVLSAIIRKNLQWKLPVLGGSWMKHSSNHGGKNGFHGFCVKSIGL